LKHADKHSVAEGHAKEGHYRRLGLMVAASFVAMYVLMYAMVDRLDNVFHNINQVYMAGLMASAMVPIELALMRAMYPDRGKNAVALTASFVALVACWLMVRNQAAVGDRQFLRSMIPHHSAAVLMCREAPIQDARVVDLCRRILANQEAEIEEMKSYLGSPAP
jgi:uncharacterized protein (DUF305 family)